LAHSGKFTDADIYHVDKIVVPPVIWQLKDIV